MTLTEPIVEGAYYEREDGVVARAQIQLVFGVFTFNVGGVHFKKDGARFDALSVRLTRRVYIVPVDPIEVVAELRERSSEANRLSAIGYGDAPSYHAGRNEAFDSAADLVAEKMGIK